jgi:hypothetical protein
MRGRGAICSFLGHRWHAAADVHEPFPVLECLRCGRRTMLTSDTTIGEQLRRSGETVQTVTETAGDRWQPKSRRRRWPGP